MQRMNIHYPSNALQSWNHMIIGAWKHYVSAAGLSQMQLQKSLEQYQNIPKNP